MNTAPDSLAVGLADRYTIERQLGQGGMASVYLARDLRHDRDVALKVLHDDLAEALGRERFVREIHLAARLSHPHILPLYDSGEANGFLFYVMPVMRGQTVRDRLNGSVRIPVDEAVRIAAEVAEALDYAHRHDVIHRDIKPENILLHEGHAVVADFGVGKAVVAATSRTVQVTQAGVAVGTPAYMSPEQAAGDEIDGRSDLFSLGCILFEMLTGEPPFDGPTLQAIISKRFHHVPPPVAAARPAVPASVSRTVERLLERSRDERFSSGATVVKALRGELDVTARRATPSIAVLPFANMSSDPDNAFFSDGITDDIIGALTRVRGLKVAARASAFTFRGVDVDLAAIGEKLGVRHVLQGSVRRAGNRVRVTAQLMAAGDGTQQWSDRWDRDLDDIFAIQDEIARAIVSELEVRLALTESDGPLVTRPTDDLAAYELFLRGRESVRRRTPTSIRTGIDALQRAIARDPRFGLAWLGLAEAQAALSVYGYDTVKHCRAVAEDAIASAIRVGVGEAGLTRIRMIVRLYMHVDWTSARNDLETALRLWPEDGLTNVMACMYYGILRNEQAVAAAAGRASAADPLSAWAHAMIGHGWYLAGNMPSALDAFDRALGLDANSLSGCWGSALALSAMGSHAEAVRRARRSADVGERGASMLSVLALVLWRSGAGDEARTIAAEVARSAPHHGYASLIAEIEWADEGRVAELLDRALETEAGAIALGTTIGPRLRRMLDDPRHGSKVRRLSLFSHLTHIGQSRGTFTT